MIQQRCFISLVIKINQVTIIHLWIQNMSIKLLNYVSDLCPSHMHGSHSGYWKHHLGDLDWPNIWSVFATGWVSEQCCFFWFPHLLVLHHHPQYCRANFTVCQVKTTSRAWNSLISKLNYHILQCTAQLTLKEKLLCSCIASWMEYLTLVSVWRSCASATVSSSTGIRRCITVRRTLQLKLAPPPWMRSLVRWSSSSLIRPGPSLRTSWSSASAPLMDRYTVRMKFFHSLPNTK